MIETVFDRKSNVVFLGHKIRPKEKETKRDSKIRVGYNPRKNELKETRKYESITKQQK